MTIKEYEELEQMIREWRIAADYMEADEGQGVYLHLAHALETWLQTKKEWFNEGG